ncbi:MAG: type I DNA topoisomerase [Desulfobacterales bacterium]|uniref:DNA topoisomerase 1 n=1 Tax=Candidatus Desulfaltia bathyphila TaxID=2841697 RepID=A0A8J6N7H1_9BACT|nr:type I DNA topoisomerase [Candidatus Desulfaltia bathyphila]MBL7194817.1 type I DNA topoisomerase [Desulfobacterales bacterium]MBL7207198.1 type I DNA topoisomerase [Desulfobacterales bacterium]
MTKPLIIVESPTKVKTIKKYLGNTYNVAATVGHIKDLPAKEMGIDIEKGFKPKYRIIPGKKKVISSLKKVAGDASDIYLAPDPDREGEAIAYHTAEILKKQGRKFYRVLFHELTKNAINKAIAAPENLNKKKYEAQQTRRILDRLVGYQVSPLLWRKVKGGLSAGRVQSVAVRIISERERAIYAFNPEEYWSITAYLEGTEPPPFTAKLVKKDGKKIGIPDEKASIAILNEMSDSSFIVEKVQNKTTKRNPLPPFITSKLQQEAIRKLKFSAKKTMTTAQQLYEGIDLGPGKPEGLITYMRTDSTRLSKEAAEEALLLIRERFGKQYALEKPRFFKNRKKIQDAHEAIRPTSVFNTPEKIAGYLSKDQLSLYTLIWKRFVASQMKQALIDTSLISIKAGSYLFAASGSTIKFPGFMTLYMSVDDTNERERKTDDLPELSEGMVLKLNKLDPKQHFTLPPPRFSEASLVKELEENGIGRPSTYAAILSTIRQKGYVDFVKGYFIPSELGFIVNDLLVESFPDIFDVDFTARMENSLDSIEDAEADYLEVLTRFYDPFKKDLDAASESMLSMRGLGFPTDLTCPDCNRQLHAKVGKNGQYLACSGYPECKYSTNYTRDETGKIQPIELPKDEATDKICEKCDKPMVLKHGQYGPFLACSGYPECKNTKSINSNHAGQDTGVKCPEKGCGGSLVERKSRRGKIFYGCSRYPECTFAIWDKPVAKECSECGAKFLVEKTTKRQGTFYACMEKGCGYKEK